MDQLEAIRRLLDDEPPPLGLDLAGARQQPHDGTKAEARAEAQLARLLANGQPQGTPLKDSLRQEFLTRRPQAYKSRAADQYQDAVARIRRLYLDIDARAPITGSSVRAVAGAFLPLLKSDLNLLLNLPCLPAAEPDVLFTHALNSGLLSMALATQAGYSQAQFLEIAMSAVLVDVGMIRVPATIRNKAGALTAEERSEILKHPVVGADLLHPIPDLPPVAELAIYQHHERLSGAGYPKGRSGHLIHEYSRILAIADTYAAMISSRSYRVPLLPYRAMEAIVKLGSAGLLDSRLIRRLLEALSLFPVGSLVRLDSGRVGKVIQAGKADFTKPLLAILRREHGRPAPPGTLLDLSDADGDRIVEALAPDAILQDAMDGF